MTRTTIHSDYIPDNAITGVKIAENSITAREIATNAITSLYVADDSVTADKLANSINTDIATGVAALPKAGGALTGNITLGDNNKAIFGAGSDLQIYHDGSNSYINDVGTGSLYIKATNLTLADAAGEQFLNAYSNGGVLLYHNNVEKLATVSGGVTVTGTLTPSGVLTANAGVVVDNFTLDGTTLALSGSADMTLDSGGRIILSADDNGEIRLQDGSSIFGQFKDDDDRFRIDSKIQDKDMMFVGNDGGSEVTALRLDMSEAGLAIFNTGAHFAANATGGALIKGVSGNQADRDNSGYPQYTFVGNEGTGMRRVSSNILAFDTSGAERMRIDSSGHLFVATTSKNNGYPARFTTTSLSTPASEEACHILELVGNRTTNAENQNGMIQFWNKTSTAAETARISGVQGTALNSGALTFATYAAGTYGEGMRIDQNGNVGIGTADAGNAKLVIAAGVNSGDLPCIDFDGYGNRGDGASQSINFRLGRIGQATDQAAQIRSLFQGGGATAAATAIGFEFRPITANVVATTVRFAGDGQRIQFWSDEIPQSSNPITNQAFIIGPSSSGAITQGLTNGTVLQNRGGELYAVDSSHNNTQITPHNWSLISDGPSEELAWTYYSQRPNPSNPDQLQGINVDMAKVIRKVEDLVGEKLIYTENSNMDSHSFKTIISDIQTTLADLKTRVETLEG